MAKRRSTIRAQKLAVDSRYAKIMRVMQDAEQRRPRIRRLGDKLGAWYTPLALAARRNRLGLSGDPTGFSRSWWLRRRVRCSSLFPSP